MLKCKHIMGPSNNQNSTKPRLGHKLSLITYALFIILFVMITPSKHVKGTAYAIVFNFLALYIIITSIYFGFVAKEEIIPGRYRMYDEKGFSAMFYATVYIIGAVVIVGYARYKGYVSF